MGGVFINYRVDDNPVAAAAIHDKLAGRFGQDDVFRDIVSMRPGEDYPDELRAALERVDVLVCVMGPRWRTLTDRRTGEPRIMRKHDWVRREIARALERGIPVVPVLLTGIPEQEAVPPTPEDLPEDIRALAHKQVFELNQRRLGEDMERLATRLVRLVPALAIHRLFAAPPAPWRPDNAPSTLLRAEYGKVPFTERDRELADLRAWAAGSAASSARLVVGPAGSGKTRLARALCDQLVGRGWLAGIVSGEAPAVQIGYTAAIDKPLLAVVDDVEVRADQLVALAAAIGDRSAVRDAPTRLLLLGRAAGDWLKALQGNGNQRVVELLGSITEQSVIRLDAGAGNHYGQFNAARVAFAAALDLPVPGEMAPPVRVSASLLECHAAALDSLLRPTAAGPQPALVRVLRHDRRHLRRLARQAGRTDLDTGMLAAICAAATLCRPASEEQAEALRERLPDLLGDLDESAVDEYVDWLALIYPGPYPLSPLRPDPLGEHLVAATMAARPAMVGGLATTCTDGQLVNALTVLGRAMGRHRELADAVVALIRVAPHRMIMLGIEVAGRLEEPEPFVRALAAAIGDGRLSQDAAVALLERVSTTGAALNPLKAVAHRVFTDVLAKPLGALVRPADTPEELAPLIRGMDRMTEFLQDALHGFIDPGSGKLPKGPDGQDIVPAPLLDSLRKIVVNREWFSPKEGD